MKNELPYLKEPLNISWNTKINNDENGVWSIPKILIDHVFSSTKNKHEINYKSLATFKMASFTSINRSKYYIKTLNKKKELSMYGYGKTKYTFWIRISTF